MPGPHGRRNMPGAKSQVKTPGKILKRILGYTFSKYKIQSFFVIICILISVFANIRSTLFMQELLDVYIPPLMKVDNPDFSNLIFALIKIGIILALAVLASFVQARLMMYISQGTLRNLRDDLFTHMENLPIKYFDTHPHGDIMSVYTNDIDTLRQMISQSIPQLISSAISIVSISISMIVLSVPLALITFAMVGVMLFVT